MSDDDFTVNTIELDENHRLVVEIDTDRGGDAPNTWNDDDVHWHCIRKSRDYVTANTDNDPHGDQIDTIADEVLDESDRDEALAKHFRRAGMPHLIVDLNSYRDFVGEYVVYGEPDVTLEQLEGEVDTMRHWLNGEVYVISLEERVRWQRTDEGGTPSRIVEPNEMFTWETVESIGSVYLDASDDDEVKKYAAWQFSLEGQYGLPETV